MYRYVEDTSIADVAFEAEGGSLAELLREAGKAVTAVMVKDLAAVQPREARSVEVEAPDAELLVHRFLAEIVYLKDAELLLLSDFDLRVAEAPGGGFRASGTARGEPLDAARHAQVVDVKAVTWHRFAVEQGPRGWRAFVVLDI